MNDHRPRRVLVTGGAGFIGSNFIRRLLATDVDVEVVNLDALTYAGRLENVADVTGVERYTFIHGSICDAALVATLLRDRAIDTVVHFAAESHVDRSICGPGAFIETNVVGTLTLLEAVRETWRGDSPCRFHHVSTDEVYGSLRASDAPFNEESPYRPNSPYAASKAASDHLVRAYAHTYSLPVTLSTCSNNFGPYQHDEKFIPTVIRACREGAPIPIYGDGSNRRDWLFVDDHCRAIDEVLRRGVLGETYCIGGGAEKANLEVASMICEIMDDLAPARAPHSKLLTHVTDRLGHDWRYALSASKLEGTLGWRPRRSFAEALEETVRWYATRATTPAAGHPSSATRSR